MFEYDDESPKAVEVLDKYDLTNLLSNFHGSDIYEIIDCIDGLGNDEITKAVQDLTIDEFVTYLEKRYKMRSEEVTRYAMWWSGK